METNRFERKFKEDKPVLAICYDFDKTLSPNDMQAQGYIQSVGYDIQEFWKESNDRAYENDMDQNLAYMYKMVEEAEGKIVFTREKLQEYGSKVNLFPGVKDWFSRIREYGKERGVIVEHYIISSGLKEMIEGTEIAKNGEFERIYASSFYYNERGVAKWPAQAINYTNKTQFLFRIEKGVLDVNDQGVNEYFPPDQVRVPFRNMVYIGDSDTDIPCMKLVNTYGGYAIGVYDPDSKDKRKVYKMIGNNRIKYFAEADYREDTELDILIKSIIDRTGANEKLEAKSYVYRQEAKKNAGFDNNEEIIKKSALIIALENSNSFANTHTIIAQLSEYSGWEDEEKEMLFTIARENNQVTYILKDSDVLNFYKKLVENLKKPYSDNAKFVMEKIGK